jgi:hypothetical protein
MSPLHKDFKATYDYFGTLKVRAVDYLQSKKDSLVPNAQGAEYLHFVVAGNTGERIFT